MLKRVLEASTTRSTPPLEVNPMVMRTDPFRDLDRLTQQLLGATAGTPAS